MIYDVERYQYTENIDILTAECIQNLDHKHMI